MLDIAPVAACLEHRIQNPMNAMAALRSCQHSSNELSHQVLGDVNVPVSTRFRERSRKFDEDNLPQGLGL